MRISALALALSGLLLGLAHPPSPATPPMTLFTFDSTSAARWTVVNDGVMGGRSEGFVAIEDGALVFTGTLVTRGGGFTSVRAEQAFDLGDAEGLELRVRGGGRTFEVEVVDGFRLRGRIPSRRAPFETTSEWRTVRVPFSALRPSIFGRRVGAPALDPSDVRRVGFFIADGQDGPFRLEVDWVRTYHAGE